MTRAIYDSGYASNAQFYGEAQQMLGMAPTTYRAGGLNTEIRFAIGECSLGAILVATSEIGVCAILLGDDADALARQLQDRFPRATLVGGDTEFEALVARVVGFVEAPALGLDLPLDVQGTAFQQRVWQALREIPAGIDDELRRDRRAHRVAEIGEGGSRCLRGKLTRRGNPVSPRGADRWRTVGLPLGSRAEARACCSGRRDHDRGDDASFHRLEQRGRRARRAWLCGDSWSGLPGGV